MAVADKYLLTADFAYHQSDKKKADVLWFCDKTFAQTWTHGQRGTRSKRNLGTPPKLTTTESNYKWSHPKQPNAHKHIDGCATRCLSNLKVAHSNATSYCTCFACNIGWISVNLSRTISTRDIVIISPIKLSTWKRVTNLIQMKIYSLHTMKFSGKIEKRHSLNG